MDKGKTSEAQIKASTKWNQANKEKMKHIRNRSGAKNYIKAASMDDLEELKGLISDREKELKETE